MSNSSFYSNTGITSADVSSITSAKEAAATSETNAATSATEAANSATQAATSATNAASSETNVSNSAATATTSAANASTSETNASASAATATTQASNAATSATAAAGSASTAGTSATNAASSATNAATSETNAATSETNAANSATSAATSATNAGTSETNAAASASSASGYVTSATTQANNAATSATAAATSETNAASSATAASTSASGASTSASNANTSATNAASSASQAATSAAAAALAADNFDDTYLGSNASDPTTDNDGDALNAGDLHFNTTSNTLKVYNGSAWQDAAIDSSGFVQTTGDTMTGALNVLANVGIGTSSPSANLEIAQSGNNVGLLVSGGGYNYTAKFESSDAEANIIIEDSNSTNDGNMIGVATNDMYFITNTSEAMRITSSGSVGIGTSSPVASLDVIANSGAGCLSLRTRVNNDYSFLTFRSNDGTEDLGGSAIYRSAASTSNLLFYTANGGAATERMRITSDGSVGIGTTSPANLLELDAGSGSNAGMTIRMGTGNSGANDSFIGFENSAGTEIIRTRYDNPLTSYVISSDTSGDILSVTRSGNVGIGTTSPAGTLHAVANSGTTGLLLVGAASNNIASFYTSGNSQAMTLDASGNLLVGKTSTAVNTQGIQLGSNGRFYATSDGAESAVFNRKTSDGVIASFRKDNTTVGSLSTNAGAFVVKGASTTAPVQLQTHDGNEDIEVDPDGFIKMETAGSERLRIDSSGNVLVGKSSSNTGSLGAEFRQDGLGVFGRSADYPLILNRTTNDGGILLFRKDGTTVGSIGHDDTSSATHKRTYIGYGDTGLAFIPTLNEIVGHNTSTNAPNSSITLGDQNVPFEDLYLSGNAYADNFIGTNDTNTFIAMTGGDVIRHFTGGSEAMRIDSNGRLMSGTTTQLGQVTIENQSNNTGLSLRQTSSSINYSAINIINDYATGGQTGLQIRFADTSNSEVGSIRSTVSSTSFNTSSDHRLKENVVELTGATDRLKQLEPKRFNFIADADTTVDGFIAHEVQTVVPEAITGTHNEVDDDGNPVYQGIDQSKLVPLLVATIKELEARITALENA